MLVLGLTSKNNRSRVEAAEAIGEIMQDEGVHVADKARHKPLPALAQVQPFLMHHTAYHLSSGCPDSVSVPCA